MTSIVCQCCVANVHVDYERFSSYCRERPFLCHYIHSNMGTYSSWHMICLNDFLYSSYSSNLRNCFSPNTYSHSVVCDPYSVS